MVFCDLRGFTAFAESAEPEEVMAVLHEYYRCWANHRPLRGHAAAFRRRRALMIIFNDPLPVPGSGTARGAHGGRDARRGRGAGGEMAPLRPRARLRRRHRLGAMPHWAASATRAGFIIRPIGTVVNLGSRLCAQAADGQILIDGRVQLAVEAIVSIESIGELDLKGFHRPVRAYNVRELTA